MVFLLFFDGQFALNVAVVIFQRIFIISKERQVKYFDASRFFEQRLIKTKQRLFLGDRHKVCNFAIGNEDSPFQLHAEHMENGNVLVQVMLFIVCVELADPSLEILFQKIQFI